ncbi:MAG TPA: STAS domain-containing protein [Isosphaeraceae bacterium]
MSRTIETQDAFTIERRGEMMIVTAAPALESVGMGLEDLAARMLIEPLKGMDEPVVLFDLSQVNYFGSVFLAVMIRCWKVVLAKSGTMALAGVSSHARELLHVTALDTAWPMYADRREAVEALQDD